VDPVSPSARPWRATISRFLSAVNVIGGKP
jgi:hypothetical protein